MSTYQKSIGQRAIRHANVSSKEHQEDVQINNERRGVYWVAVKREVADNHRVIPALGGGIYFVRVHPLHEVHRAMIAELAAATFAITSRVESGLGDSIEQHTADELIRKAKRKIQQRFEQLSNESTSEDTGELVEVSGDQLVEVLDTWKADTCYYLREINDPKCKGGRRWKREAHVGIQGHVITTPPWVSNTVYEAAERGDHVKIQEMCVRIAHELALRYEAETSRRVLSVQCHFDSTQLHWHLFSTRIGRNHKFIKNTKKAFGLAGPWAVGVRRQVAAGVIPEGDEDALAAKRKFERNIKRHGGKPLDAILGSVADDICYEIFGENPRFAFWLGLYRSRYLQRVIEVLVDLGTSCLAKADRLKTVEGFRPQTGLTQGLEMEGIRKGGDVPSDAIGAMNKAHLGLPGFT